MDENCGNVVMPKAKLSFFGSLCTLQNVICCRSIQGSCGDFLGTMWPGGLPISMWGHSEIDHFLLQKSLQILVTSTLFVRYKQFQKVVSRKNGITHFHDARQGNTIIHLKQTFKTHNSVALIISYLLPFLFYSVFLLSWKISFFWWCGIFRSGTTFCYPTDDMHMHMFISTYRP